MGVHWLAPAHGSMQVVVFVCAVSPGGMLSTQPNLVQGAMDGSTTAYRRSRAGGRTWWAAGCHCARGVLFAGYSQLRLCTAAGLPKRVAPCAHPRPLCLQEDAHIAHHLSDECHIFGVFDGHGGPEVARFCSKRMPGELVGCPGFVEGRYEEGLKQVRQKCWRMCQSRPGRRGNPASSLCLRQDAPGCPCCRKPRNHVLKVRQPVATNVREMGIREMGIARNGHAE